MSLLRPHHADPGEHRWPVVLCNQEKRLHHGLPFVGIVFCLGQFGDEERGVATSGFRPGSISDRKTADPTTQTYPTTRTGPDATRPCP
jgi:hypothetical protein